MYKHHSYNNLIEKKLEQLPGPDTGALWSGMEAILDQQMPQKKRRPGMLGWLLGNKALVLTALSIVSVAGASLVYFGGKNSLAAPQSSLIQHTQNNTTASIANGEAATNTITDATARASSASATTNTHQNNSTTAAATLGTQEETSSVKTTAASGHDAPAATTGGAGINNEALTIASASSGNHQQPSAIGAAGHTGADNSTVMSLVATTRAIEVDQKTAPAIDAAGVNRNTGSLNQLAQSIAAATAAARKPGRLPEEKGPYAGVVVGLDLSSVGFESLNAGNNKGLIVGYAFNNHWSLESGLLWNKKKYYAAGEHYKPDGFTVPAGVTMLHVDNITTLYEFPVNVKYNFLTGTNKLFATAGVSSYFMKKEAFDLHYRYNGNEYDEYNSYKNASKHWLSVASLSLGYSHKLGSFGTVRVEPYMKLPLRDLGVGNMRVTSTGVNVGFTKPLKRY